MDAGKPEIPGLVMASYNMGRTLAQLAKKHPDELHAVFVGLKFGLEEIGIRPWLGIACEALEHRARFVVPDTATLPLLALREAPSGTGKL